MLGRHVHVSIVYLIRVVLLCCPCFCSLASVGLVSFFLLGTYDGRYSCRSARASCAAAVLFHDDEEAQVAAFVDVSPQRLL